ncbi:hypothetical protein HAX54_008705, partial [Datura stramonium]|nr:hypothetical protein [Datura stramonium]
VCAGNDDVTDGTSDNRQEGDEPSLMMFRGEGRPDGPSEWRQPVTCSVGRQFWPTSLVRATARITYRRECDSLSR